jgi:hypothetical protein
MRRPTCAQCSLVVLPLYRSAGGWHPRQAGAHHRHRRGPPPPQPQPGVSAGAHEPPPVHQPPSVLCARAPTRGGPATTGAQSLAATPGEGGWQHAGAAGWGSPGLRTPRPLQVFSFSGGPPLAHPSPAPLPPRCRRRTPTA